MYIGTVLPFELWFLPKIFSTVADTLLWIMHQNGVSYIYTLHYLEDFLFAGEVSNSACGDSLECMGSLYIPLFGSFSGSR